MDIATLEASRQHWQFAADSLPQLVFLLDRQCRIVSANRTFQSWGLGDAQALDGCDLHQALHPHCPDADCYLRSFLSTGTGDLGAGRSIRCDAFDRVLKRFLVVAGEPARREPEASAAVCPVRDLLGVITFEDVTHLRCPHDRVVRLNRDLGDDIVAERNRRRQVEGVCMRMQAVVERIAGFVAMTNVDGKLIYLNPAGRESLGFGAREDLSALTLHDLHAESVRARLTAEVLPAALASGTWRGRSVLKSRGGAEIEILQVVIAHQGFDGRFDGMSAVMHDMTEWLKGENALRQSHLELRRLSAQLISVQEDERKRIAADLHDGIGQSLSLMQMHVGEAMKQLEGGNGDEALRALRLLKPKLKETMTDVRRLSTDLHPASLEDLGILATLSWFFRELDAACGGIRVDKDFGVCEADVPPALRVAIFRILQEAVSNIVKHAAPTRIGVRLHKRGNDLLLAIEDNGRGFDPASPALRDHPGRGFGLSSMQERARLSGGIYELHSAVGRGTRISIVWPTSAAATEV